MTKRYKIDVFTFTFLLFTFYFFYFIVLHAIEMELYATVVDNVSVNEKTKENMNNSPCEECRNLATVSRIMTSCFLITAYNSPTFLKQKQNAFV